MITPDAKCVNNGKKVNEAINAINPLLGMSVGYTAGGTPPQVTYSDTEVKILLPLADSVEGFSLEELDVVDSNNAASSRYFMTSLSSVSTYGTTTASTSGTPTGKQSTPQPTKGRNKLDAGSNTADNNRDKLTTGGAPRDTGGGGVMPAGMVKPGSQAARDGFDDTPKMGDFMVKPGSQAARDGFDDTIGGTGGRPLAPSGGGVIPSGMVKPGSQAAKDGFDDTPLPGAPPLGGDTTPPPIPGAPPLGDTDKAAADKAAADTAAADTAATRRAAAAQTRQDNYNAKVQAGNERRRKAKEEELARIAKEKAEEERKRAEEERKRAEDTKRRTEAGDALREKNQARTDANKYGEIQDWEAANVQSIMEDRIVKIGQLGKWLYDNRHLAASDPTYKAKRDELQIARWEYGKAKTIHLRNVNNRS